MSRARTAGVARSGADMPSTATCGRSRPRWRLTASASVGAVANTHSEATLTSAGAPAATRRARNALSGRTAASICELPSRTTVARSLPESVLATSTSCRLMLESRLVGREVGARRPSTSTRAITTSTAIRIPRAPRSPSRFARTIRTPDRRR